MSLITVSLIGCAVYTAPTREETLQVVKSSFQDRGIAKLDRLNQSELQVACSEVALTGKELPKDLRARLEKQALATVKLPADGVYLGDFKQGERIAQTGVGMQWSDTDKTVAGGNCYACHEVSPQEIAFGNIGPSLKGYRKAAWRFAGGVELYMGQAVEFACVQRVFADAALRRRQYPDDGADQGFDGAVARSELAG